ncbi:hypothetical protein SSBR45G_47220 [Bradyrhizobium sp. SSBR45G]|uniref:hypothetical protein n=1 Tax=unclassified Bradyrhizobium TaxID=2631580 RepID=UPI002342B4FF|nr:MULTISPECIES: hypothetical protein [unclassified Bradyrhizobium]GLH79813.1 hypothetical protein SSBR45G_47220 [Bradyrhizobium sp. SSBR45G]GLH87069.1 hypothetical protein SSBR45R_45290 [Bradyrhizobium sp. SSBR45R]
MSSIELPRDACGAFVTRAIRPSRLIKTLHKAISTVHAAIAAAKLRRLRNELLLRQSSAAAIAPDASRRPQAPLILGDKWDF